MGPAGSLGLCLVLSSAAWTLGEMTSCRDCFSGLCLNSTHCGCPPGYAPPAWPRGRHESCDDINECLELSPPCGPSQTCTNTPGGFNCSCSSGYRAGPPPEGADPPGTTPTSPPGGPPELHCVDIDECTEGGSDPCGGGRLICFNTPGGFECHCPPGYLKTPPQNHCVALLEPPQLCPEQQSDCEELKPLSLLYERLRGGEDPPHVLQELLTLLDRLFEEGVAPGGASLGGGRPPQRHLRATALLEATERLLGGVGSLLPPGSVTNVSSRHSALLLAALQGPPPGAVTLQGPRVQLEVPGEGHNGSLVALLTHGGALGRVLEGGPQVEWEGWGELGPPAAPPSYQVLSPIATVLLRPPRGDPPRGDPPGSKVTLRFLHPPPDPKLGGRLLCAFWDPQKGAWATGGCREVPPESGGPPPGEGTACACDHLSSFAVLLAFRELQDHWVLDVVTKVGLGVSIAALLLALATFLLVRALRGLRTTLHLHLSLSLLLAQATFLLGIDSTHNKAWCAVVAGLLHYWFLAAFCWMGLEGLHLHVLLVRVFLPSWLRLPHLLLAGYGPPALLLCLAAAAYPGGYGTPRYCWLTLERGFRWSFQGPVCVILALNAAVLVVTIWKLVQKFGDINPDWGHLRRMRVLVVTSLGQLCLLGTGWALGLGLGLGGAAGGGEGGGLEPLPLLFSALNASQGLFILICHCLAHPQVREAYRSCLCPGAKPYSEFSSSNTTRVSRQVASSSSS